MFLIMDEREIKNLKMTRENRCLKANKSPEKADISQCKRTVLFSGVAILDTECRASLLQRMRLGSF